MSNSTQSREDMNLLHDVLIHGKEQMSQLEKYLNERNHAAEYKLLAKQVHWTLTRAAAMVKINCKSSDSSRSRKRRILPRWTSQVFSSSGTMPDDGYSWEKFGQKNILGAKFPRSYFRCTHRKNRGCLATKQAQLSDYDPSFFNITYRVQHTCARSRRSPPTAAAGPSSEETDHSNLRRLLPSSESNHLALSPLNGIISTANLPSSEDPDHTNIHRPFTTNFKVETEGLLPSSSSSPSTPVSCAMPGSNLAESFSPTFNSSESNHLALSPLKGIISAANLPTSVEPDHTNLHRPFTTNIKVETEGLLPSSSSSPSTPVSCARPGSNLAESFSPTFNSSESNHLALSPLNGIISAANLPSSEEPDHTDLS